MSGSPKPLRLSPRTPKQLKLTILTIIRTKRPALFPNGVRMTPDEAREIANAGFDDD